jgi:hypothetical protein
MTPEEYSRGLRVWWLVYRVSIVNVYVPINTCGLRLMMSAIPVSRVMMIVMIVMRLVTAG